MKRGIPKTNTKKIRPPKNIQELAVLQRVIGNSTSLSRSFWSTALGESYGGDRNLYQALGYKIELKYEDYYRHYKRGDIAKVIINKVPKAVWTSPPVVTDSEENSEFAKEYGELADRLDLYPTFYRADKLLGLGEYAVLLLGFNDVTDQRILNTEVVASESLDINFIEPYSSEAAKIHELESDMTSPRYGKPKTYQIDMTQANVTVQKGDKASHTVLVNHTRVIHLVEEPLENTTTGTPRLEAVFNRLQDIEKILGGSGEMYWRGALPGKIAKAGDDAAFDAETKDDLQTQFDEYEHNLRRWLKVENVDIKTIEADVSSPKEFLAAQLNIISIVTGIPKRILMGSERGELASSQDQDAWNSLLKSTMENQAGPVFVSPFVDRMIEYGILPEPKDGTYTINWPEIISIGEKDQAEIAKNRMTALKEYLQAPGADMLVPPEIFLRDELGYSQSQIDEIMEIIGNFKEDDDFDEEEEEEEI